MENRIEKDIRAWRKQEEQIASLFPASVLKSRDFQQQRLKELNWIYYAHRADVTDAEKLSRRILNIERRQLEKQLYPGLVVQLLRRLIKIPAILPRQAQNWLPGNEQSVRDALVLNGFKNVHANLAKHIGEGSETFTLTHTEMTASGKRLDYELAFKKDEKGLYQFTGYHAALKVDGKPAETKRQHFTIDPRANNVKADEAANLLEGRSVRKLYLNAEGHVKAGWTSLDFNDRDARGNHTLKHCTESAGYDITTVLRSFPLQDKSAADKLSQRLQNGERVAVTLEKEGKPCQVLLDANPQTRLVNIYSTGNKKLTFAEAVGENKEVAKVVELKQEKCLKQGRRQGRSVY